ncbi:PIR protein [Plasmodium yoelii]|uniref:PIR protein n=2 Tax=Plasmodium yoelii TaxID=5861 RepID=A0AAF0B409_PLAYO|nr:PIR protein [Plasmodium yoelii]XP_034493445.1 PIR protein [Plasmodium yoelii]WBY56187.1 PIR protein [Plasmodium yoelii yoelii]WBY58948.1 PIR protein [Plasmodium yoelii yoelii]VTZ76129.1 PIR protein [Plasmodium yoelii]VTZ79780.1 PIR protein [Plasmodium yoelii]|eukprot:XP_022811096.2 PIR protein [Plasmodium yoelii]
MDDNLCGKIELIRKYLPDDSDESTSLDFYGYKSFENYCPNKNCHDDLEKITIGFLWLLEQYFIEYPPKGGVINYNKPFFLYIILWLSYKLNQNTEETFTTINDFYTDHIKNGGKYSNFNKDSNRFPFLEEFIEKNKDLLNIDIKDLSKFYDASKLICSMYANKYMNTDGNKLLNDATMFVKKYAELKDGSNTEGTSNNQILPALSADYNNIKEKSKHIQTIPEITADVSALISRVTSSSSSTGNKLFTVLSIFGAIAFFLGISYKYSLFGFRKRFQKQHLREKIKKIKKKMNH